MPAARAEVVHFVRGGQIVAPAEARGGEVVIDSAAGRFTFPSGDVARIEPGGLPDREWPARRDAALASDAPACHAAAAWALDHGLVREGVPLLREAHLRDPSSARFARLATVLEALDRPCDDPDVGSLEGVLGVTLNSERSAHVLLLHQLPAAEARVRVNALEDIVVAFHFWLAGLDVDAKLPTKRLVAVVLKDHADYLRFLKTQNAAAFSGTLGYYHPTYRVVVGFDTRGQFRWQDHPPAPPSSTSRDAQRRWLLRETERRSMELGTAFHEMTHLLVTTSRLADPADRFPLWLHEGLAMQFESVRDGRWAGLGGVNELRLADFRALTRPAELAPLIEDAGFGRGYRRDVYARSWALVHYLRAAHPARLVALIDAYRLPEPPPGPGRYRTRFLENVGSDLPSLDAAWNHWMKTAGTPITPFVSNVPHPEPPSLTFDRD